MAASTEPDVWQEETLRMTGKVRLAAIVLTCIVLSAGIVDAQTANWRTASPESVGLDSNRLAANMNSLPGPLAVVRNGSLVYSKGDIAHPRDLFSISKSLTALIFGRLLLLGQAHYDDLVPGSAVPTVPLASYRHFLNMTSDYGLTPRDPGKQYAYNSHAVHFYGSHMARTFFGGRSAPQVLQEAILNYTGRQDSVSFAGHWGGWDGGWRMSTRDLARIGLMVVNDGVASGLVVPSDFIGQLYFSQIGPGMTPNWSQGPEDAWNEHSFTQVLPGSYSFGWWIVRNLYPEALAEAIAASGRRGKMLIVSRQYNLVIAVLADVYAGPTEAQYLNAVIDAITEFGSPPPPSNAAPIVSAGGDLAITLPTDTVSLDGTVSDDGLPNPPGQLTATWSAVSGPGTVTFASSNAADTTARFSTAGSYVLRLTASDGSLSASDDVTVTVRSASPMPSNTPPVVHAGPDQSMTLPTNTVSLDGSVSDDGLPSPPGQVTVSWSQVSGPATVAFANAGVVDTTASFSAAGSYTLRLMASDGELTASDDLLITVLAAPAATIAVTSFTLIDADTDQPIPAHDPLVDGARIRLGTLPTRNLNIRANTSPATVGSVRFSVDGTPNTHTDSIAPYALYGDNSGNYNAWTPLMRGYLLKATPYPQGNAGGAAGTSFTIRFTVTQ
jgi:CubicO group peptidase (beta-lactamase class C family)